MLLRLFRKKLDIEADRKDVIRLLSIGYFTIIPLLYYSSIFLQALYSSGDFQTGPVSLLLLPVITLLVLLVSWLLFPSKWPFIVGASTLLVASLIAQYRYGLQAYTSFIIHPGMYIIFLDIRFARVLSALFFIGSSIVLLITMQASSDILQALHFFVATIATYSALDLYAKYDFSQTPQDRTQYLSRLLLILAAGEALLQGYRVFWLDLPIEWNALWVIAVLGGSVGWLNRHGFKALPFWLFFTAFCITYATEAVAPTMTLQWFAYSAALKIVLMICLPLPTALMLVLSLFSIDVFAFSINQSIWFDDWIKRYMFSLAVNVMLLFVCLRQMEKLAKTPRLTLRDTLPNPVYRSYLKQSLTRVLIPASVIIFLTLLLLNHSALNNHPLTLFVQHTLGGTGIWLLMLVLLLVTLILSNAFARARYEEGEALRYAEKYAHANQIKSRFLANMSHEIRTPLNAIIGLIYLAEKEPTQQKVLERVSEISDSSKTLLALINDILDISKIEANELTLESRPFNLFATFDHWATTMRGLTTSKDIEAHLYIENIEHQVVVGDELRLSQIVINLISNAVKFTPHGSVVVTVKSHQAGIDITVTDTGIGMSEETLENILSPFTQANTSIAREHGGTGLGLSIVSALCHLMGGELIITSEEGHGTKVQVSLPLQSSNHDMPYQKSTHIDFAKVRVLVADDSEIARRSIVAILEGFGCVVDSVDSGQACVDSVLLHLDTPDAYHIVFLDWRMSGMDGFEAMKTIKQKAGHRAPVIIIDTAYGRELIYQNHDATKLDGLLVKPVTPSDLFDMLVTKLNTSPAVSQTPHDVASDQRLAGLHVLIAEDNSVNQVVEKAILNSFGARVSIADNGQVAFDLVTAGEQTFDLILMDMQMPIMDGLTATKALRQTEQGRSIPIVALTANAMKQERDNCIAAGMNDYLTKPIDPELVVNTILRFCSSR
jgi:signal transduction histidine kinase/CheY-like chemotaxis protein